MEHDLFLRTIQRHNGPKTIYIHAGSQGRQLIDIKLVSQQLWVAFEKTRASQKEASPASGCFYFEFDRHDSRRGGIKAMITSFICTCACRFWKDGDEVLTWSGQYLKTFKCWSLKDLITLFLRVQQSEGMKKQTIILGQLDQCDQEERLIFLKAVLRQQSRADFLFHILITTSIPDDLICDILPPDSVINLADCPLSREEHL